MGGKHLKRLRAEKSKVKLKKKLPKGQNITNTAFQVKKILIAEQLRDHEGLAVTSRHQTLHECLNYLNHHNYNKQLDGLKGIRELVLNGPVARYSKQMRQIVAKLLDVAVEDRESKVRRAAISLLNDLLRQLPYEVKSSYIELLQKQLLRGLSNINPGIQNDAVSLIDVLLISSEQHTEIWQPIVELLLRLLTMTGSSAPPRVFVFRRLHSLCTAALKIPKTTDYSKMIHITSNDRLEPLTTVYKQISVIPLAGAAKQPGVNIQDLFERIIRTGFGIWTEMGPDRLLDSKKLEIVSILTSLSLLLYRYLQRLENSQQMKRWFVDTFRDLIIRNFLNHYPFQVFEALSNKPKEKEPDLSIQLLETNISMVELFVCLKKDLPISVSKFVNESIRIRPVVSAFIPSLEALIKADNQQIVKKIAASCLAAPDDKLNAFLQTVAVDETLTGIHQFPEFQEWMAQLVTNPKFAYVLAKHASLGVNQRLISAVRKNREKLLTEGSANREVLNILYWTCPHPELVTATNDEKYPENVRNYLKSIL